MIKKKLNEVLSSFTFNLIFRILIIILLVLFICFYLLGNIMTKNLTNQIREHTMLSFQKTEKEISIIFNNAKETITQLYFNEMSNYLSKDEQDDLSKIQTLIELKKSMQETNVNQFDFISIINTYSNTAILTKNEFLTFDNSETLFHKSILEQKQHSFFYGYLSLKDVLSKETNSKDYIYVACNLKHPYLKSENDIKIITGISKQTLADTYSHIQGEQNNIIIIDKEGYQLANKHSSEFGNKLSYYDKLINNNSSFTHIIDGIEYKIIPYKLEELGWTIINQIPVDIYMSDVKEIMRIIIYMFIACVFLISLLCIYQVKYILKPFYALKSVIGSLSKGNLTSRFKYPTEITELKTIGDDFNKMADNINVLIKNEKDFQSQKNNLEMQALIAQINPHFIHNTLNIIKWMAMINGNDNIVNVTKSMTNILAPTFRNKNLSWTIKEEYNFLKEYINILEIRFGGDITVNFYTEKELFEYFIPRFIIQPLIENSITHGYTPGAEFVIDITVTNDRNNIKIIVYDNGVGINKSQIDFIANDQTGQFNYTDNSRGIGLPNIKNRLELFYKESYIFMIDQKVEKGTKIIISIPLEYDT